jgi:hypothetical protein
MTVRDTAAEEEEIQSYANFTIDSGTPSAERMYKVQGRAGYDLSRKTLERLTNGSPLLHIVNEATRFGAAGSWIGVISLCRQLFCKCSFANKKKKKLGVPRLDLRLLLQNQLPSFSSLKPHSQSQHRQ